MLFALGLPGSATSPPRRSPSTSARSRRCSRPTRSEITEVDGVGPILAEEILEQLADERTAELIERLRERGLRLELDAAERRAEGGPLDGKTFVLTGTLPELCRDRRRS